METLITYFGGKAQLAPMISSLIPPGVFNLYAEPFCGSAAVFFNAPGRWAPVEILNDINHHLIRLYRVLQDDGKRYRLLDLLDATPHSREMWKEAGREIEKDHDDVTLAWYWYIHHQQSFNTARNSWKIPTKKRNVARQWQDHIARLELDRVIVRLQQATLECISFEQIWSLYDSPDSLFYVDPPYVGAMDQAGMKKAYSGFVLSAEQNASLIKLCIEAKSGIILSGYSRDDLPDDWQRIEIQQEVKSMRISEGTQRRVATEVLWVNPRAQIGRLF
jgi:DNA adenine methylase